MLNLLASPEMNLVGLAEIKTHLRLDHAHDDEYLDILLQASTNLVEEYLGRSLLMKTWQVLWHAPEERSDITAISLPYPPLVEIRAVNKVFANNQREAIRRYMLDTTHAQPKIFCKGGCEVIEVIYKAGYGELPRNVPAPIRQAVLLMITDLYENRGNASLENNTLVQALLSPYRVLRLP